MPDDKEYWFPAKKGFGWGWGPPTVWQGWVALLVPLLLLAVSATRLLPGNPVGFLLATLLAAVVTTIICYLKGEPPGGSWSGKP